MAAILQAAAAGEMTSGNAAAFASLVDTYRKAIETAELERRITALEEEATANESL